MKSMIQNLTKSGFLALSIVGLFAGCARDQQSAMGGVGSGSQTLTGSAVPPDDSNFAREACQTGTAEMEIGKLAAQNTRNKEVRKFARTLSEDHAKAEKELSQLFSRKGLPPEKELAGNYQSSLERLAGLKGGQFDAAFKEQVVADHEQAIDLFAKQAEQGTDAELKAFAEKRLPQLRTHLEMARTLPISSDTEGPPPQPNPNTILQHPIIRMPAGPR
jgi:putative membrane protein